MSPTSVNNLEKKLHPQDPTPMIHTAKRLLTLSTVCALVLCSCEEFIQPVIIPTPTPVPPQRPDPDKEIEEIGPPRTPAPNDEAALRNAYIHPAAREIKELWQTTREKLQQDIDGYPQTFSYEARFEKASQTRKLWWDLNKKLVTDRDVDFSVLRNYSPFIDSVIQMIDTFYSVELNEYGERELALAKTEIRLMDDRIQRLK
jgi:hypothetical protein